MHFYLIIFILPFITSFLDFRKIKSKTKKRLFWFWIIFFILFKGLRWETGTDFPQFLACFEQSDWDNIFCYWRYGVGTEKMEFGYVFLNLITRKIFYYYTFFLLFQSIFTLLAFAFLIKKTVPKYSLLALSLMLVVTELFPVRQTFVTAILCYSIYFAFKRELKPFLFSLAICYTIHRTSLLMLPLYWLFNPNLKKWQLITIYLTLAFGRNIIIHFIQRFYSLTIFDILTGGASNLYYISEGNLEEFSIRTIINTIFHILLFCYSKEWYLKKGKDISIFNYFINIYLVFSCLNVLGSIPGLNIIYRLSNNLIVVYPILVVYSILTIINKKRLLAFSIYIVLFFIKLQSNMCLNSDYEFYNECFYPYVSVFESDGETLTRMQKWPYHN